MSLNAIFNTATSGLMTAQTQLRIVSDNVANVNTPGYVRKVGEQQSLTSQGMGVGVEVHRIRLATDRFLQAASLNAGAEASRQGVRYELYERIQSLFGDPGGDSGFFSQIDSLFSAFAATAEDAMSSPRRQDALFRAQSLFEESARITTQIQAVREDADGRIREAVDTANTLLEQIEALNVEIARSTVVGADASGAENAQARLIDELAGIMDIKVTPRGVGGVAIRTGSGLLLAGEGHAKLDYTRAGAVNSESAFSEIWVTEPQGQKKALAEHITSGEIRGLLELRDQEAPATAERLAELMTQVAEELNRAHNASSSVPAPSSLNGKVMGQTLESAIDGFQGLTTLSVVNGAGVVQSSIDIDFNGAAITINGAASSPATFLADLNAQLPAGVTASFANGALSLSSTVGGLVISDPDTGGATKNGRGFSHHFGLNDLIVSDRPSTYDTGMTGTSLHGFDPGQTIDFRFTGAHGAQLRDITVTVPAGGTVNSLLAALNSPVTGVGRFGAFALDAAGSLVFTASAVPAPTLSVIQDRTTQNPSGVSIAELFGIGGGVRASRADGFSVRADIVQDPMKLALARFNNDAAAGAAVLAVGDGRGGQALGAAGQNAARFQPAGGGAGGSLSVSRYAAELSGDIGGRAASAKSRHAAAQAVFGEARSRQVSHEGVNLDEELVLLTTYQQAFNASARLIQAASDMYDTLLGMTR